MSKFGRALFAAILVIAHGSSPSCSEDACPHASSLLQRTHQRGNQAMGSHLRESHHSQADGDAGMSTVPSILAGIPEKVLADMILPGPYPCDLTFAPIDLRFRYCGGSEGCVSLCNRTDLSDGLHPLSLSTTARWGPSTRLLLPIGSLPCCPTPPHCHAPTCRPGYTEASAGLTCTKPAADTLIGYMLNVNVWASLVGGGGAYELDVQKHWDVLGRLLGCYDNSTGTCDHTEPFDLSLDLGSDWGSITEEFTARKFAKDCILLDALPWKDTAFHNRYENPEYLKKWYTEVVVGWPAGKPYPTFEMFTSALSNQSEGVFDMCDGGTWHLTGTPCPVNIVTLDSLVPAGLSPVMQAKVAQAQSAYIKMDLDGMDQLAIDGMRNLLSQVRGAYADGQPRHLVNFMMLEFCPSCMIEAKQKKGFAKYDLATNVQLLESLGFETFFIGPNYIPLNHDAGALEAMSQLFKDENVCPPGVKFEDLKEYVCPGGLNATCAVTKCMFAGDLFAMRASHPKATEIKLALGSCTESHEFDLQDQQYLLPATP